MTHVTQRRTTSRRVEDHRVESREGGKGGDVLSSQRMGYGFVAGTFIGVMLQGLVQTYIVFDGSLSSWWTKIVVGVLLFMFIVLQRLVFRAGSRRTFKPWT